MILEHINGLLVVKETYRSDSDGGERWCRREWEVFLESEITHYRFWIIARRVQEDRKCPVVGADAQQAQKP